MPRGPRAALSQSFCVKSLLVTFNVALSKQSVEKYKNSSENGNSRAINTEKKKKKITRGYYFT